MMGARFLTVVNLLTLSPWSRIIIHTHITAVGSGSVAPISRSAFLSVPVATMKQWTTPSAEDSTLCHLTSTSSTPLVLSATGQTPSPAPWSRPPVTASPGSPVSTDSAAPSALMILIVLKDITVMTVAGVYLMEEKLPQNQLTQIPLQFLLPKSQIPPQFLLPVPKRQLPLYQQTTWAATTTTLTASTSCVTSRTTTRTPPVSTVTARCAGQDVQTTLSVPHSTLSVATIMERPTGVDVTKIVTVPVWGRPTSVT